MYQFVQKNILQSLKDKYESGKITVNEVAVELFRAGHYNFIPDEIEALNFIGINNKQN